MSKQFGKLKLLCSQSNNLGHAAKPYRVTLCLVSAIAMIFAYCIIMNNELSSVVFYFLWYWGSNPECSISELHPQPYL